MIKLIIKNENNILYYNNLKIESYTKAPESIVKKQ